MNVMWPHPEPTIFAVHQEEYLKRHSYHNYNHSWLLTFIIISCGAFIITGLSQDEMVRNVHTFFGCLSGTLTILNFLVLLCLCGFLASQSQTNAKDKHEVYSSIISSVNLKSSLLNFIVDTIAVCEMLGLVLLMACYGRSGVAVFLFIAYAGVLSIRHFLKSHLRQYVIDLSPATMYEYEGGLPTVMLRALIDELLDKKRGFTFSYIDLHQDKDKHILKFIFVGIPHVEFRITYLDDGNSCRLRLSDVRYKNETMYAEHALESPNSIDEIMKQIYHVRDYRKIDMDSNFSKYIDTVKSHVQA